MKDFNYIIDAIRRRKAQLRAIDQIKIREIRVMAISQLYNHLDMQYNGWYVLEKFKYVEYIYDNIETCVEEFAYI